LATIAQLALIVVGSTVRADEERPLHPVDGPLSLESLVQVDPDWTVVFRRQLKRRSLPVSDLVSWGAVRDRDSGTHVVLDCGSVLVGDMTAMDRDVVTVRGGLWPEIRLPKQRVRGIVFRPPLDLLQRDLLFRRICTESRSDDQLLLDNGDQMSGRLADTMEAAAGASPPDAPPRTVADASQPIPIHSSRVVAVLFSGVPSETSTDGPGQPASTPPRVLAGVSDGSQLVVQRIIHEKVALLVELTNDLQVRCERPLPAPEGPWQDLVMLQPLTGKAVYLSDLEPLGHRHVPLFELAWPYFPDANVAGGRLRHRGTLFWKGIGMHSTSRLAFDLGEPFRRLDAELAVDERAGRLGSVVFRVYVQREVGGWSKAYESPIVRGAQPPVSMQVDLRGAIRLALIVDAADRLDVWDHANWLNVRLVR
jgi:hypothetical protein